MFRSLAKSFKRFFKPTSRPYRKPRWTQLTLEALESREMLDGALSATLSGGVLSVVGTEQDDRITLSQMDNTITVDGMAGSFAADQVRSIMVDGRGGNDLIDLRTGDETGQNPITAPAVVNGGAGNDVLLGGRGINQLFGGLGDDLLVGIP